MASRSSTKEERLIEGSADFVLNPQHHIVFQTSADTPRVKYNFKFHIGVNEETFRLLQSPEHTPWKSQVTHTISNLVSERLLKLVPFKCMNCTCNDAVEFCFSGTVLNTTAVPTIFNWICFPTCQACEQTVQNAVLDSLSSVSDDRIIKVCADCGKCPRKMDCCSRCRCAFYCNRKCQRHHWKKGDHKQKCQPYKK
jgi:hypothetical protein